MDSEIIWLWIAIESETKNILAISISKERNMFVAIERFLSDIVNEFGQHPVSTADGGGTWYPQACKFLKLKHYLHSFVYKDEKSIIERTMQYIKKIEPSALTIIFHAKRKNVN